MVPRWAVDDLEVEEGQTVTVEGYVAENTPWGGDGIYLRVTRAVIDGEEYELEDRPGGSMGMGDPRGGRGGRGGRGMHGRDDGFGGGRGSWDDRG
jgi:hypothetical protein